jgi:tetratricopeptide (TPR) repeat protein
MKQDEFKSHSFSTVKAMIPLSQPRKIIGIIYLVLFLMAGIAPLANAELGRAYYDLGIFAYEEGDYQDAKANFGKALQFDSDNLLYNYHMGKICMKTKEYPEAKTYLLKAWRMNPELTGLKYDMAMLNYEMGEYSKASELFMEIIREYPSDPTPYYYAGLSLFKQARYKTAVDYLMTASEKHPYFKLTAYYYAGICYLKIGENQDAADIFTYVEKHADSETLRKYASDWLRAVEQQRNALKPYQIFLKASYEYDSNVKLEPSDQQMENEVSEDTGDFVTKAYLSCTYNFVRQKDYQIGAGYYHYQTWYQSLNTYDLIGSIFHLYGNYSLDPVVFELSYIPSYYCLDSDSFLMQHQIRTNLRWNMDGKVMPRLSHIYSRDNYFEDNDSDGHSNEILSDIYYRIRNEVYFLWQLGYERYSASAESEDYSLMHTKMGMIFLLTWDVNLTISGEYSHKKYDMPQAGMNLKQRETKYDGNISFSKKLFYEWLEISATYDFTKNDSDEDEYKRNTTAISVHLIF